MGLSTREQAVLDFERGWWLEKGTTKHDAIRRRLDLSPTQYYAILARLTDSKEARAYDPLVVHRLRRRARDRRRALLNGAAPRRQRP